MAVMSLQRGSAEPEEKPGTDVMDCYPGNSEQRLKMILKTSWEWHKEVKLDRKLLQLELDSPFKVDIDDTNEYCINGHRKDSMC
ncbi:hypothetical protein AAES_04449 [Amazona aestiva]|uniref:Uncharacterized protein n=1 Tax=Amazona aestiva TaxID=12930 RepID=A0A0Q3X6Y8_AMAAE|nr:hypothetical protein AAES_04449 [Amazona aestiva]